MRMRKIKNALMEISYFLFGEKDPINIDEKVLDDSVLLEKAKQEMQAALSFFNHVCEEKQIDQAIYKLNAAEKQYGYLLQQVKKEYWLNRTVKKEV